MLAVKSDCFVKTDCSHRSSKHQERSDLVFRINDCEEDEDEWKKEMVMQGRNQFRAGERL